MTNTSVRGGLGFWQSGVGKVGGSLAKSVMAVMRYQKRSFDVLDPYRALASGGVNYGSRSVELRSPSYREGEFSSRLSGQDPSRPNNGGPNRAFSPAGG